MINPQHRTNSIPKQNTNSNPRYEFTKFDLTEDEFNNLVFMGAPSHWKEAKNESKSCNFLYDLCHKPLKYVVEKVMRGAKHSDPNMVFERLLDIKTKDEAYPWFLQHLRISQHFNKELMDRLWIRNLTKYDDVGKPEGNKCERTKCPDGSFYLEDGNHRALVYAVHIVCGAESYRPVKVLHATSWDIANGILGHPCQPTKAIEDNGRLKLIIDGKVLRQDCEFDTPIESVLFKYS